jgi:hypothetical protein
MRRTLLTMLLALPLGAPAVAHELRPAFLDLHEVAQDKFAVLWKVPAMGDRRLALYLRLPENCKTREEPLRSIENAAYLERSVAFCPGGLGGREIAIVGLDATLTDVLSRIAYHDGTTEVARLTPESPSIRVVGTQSRWQVASTYFRLGVEHILGGLDHLFFVAALMLLIGDRWMLVMTITSFTFAHSITLAGAALGYLSLPQKPVEATIALSIAFVASELTKIKHGERRLSESYPWVVAFAFGLLHGFGFAGALKEIGLPQVEIPLALLTFNLGVETGQLLFVGSLLAAYRVVTALILVPVRGARAAAAYLIGVVSTVWLVERFAAFWG